MGIPNVKRFRPYCPECKDNFTLMAVLPKDASVEKAHDICDHLEHDLAARLSNLNVTIHVEPCDNGCSACGLSCGVRK